MPTVEESRASRAEPHSCAPIVHAEDQLRIKLGVSARRELGLRSARVGRSPAMRSFLIGVVIVVAGLGCKQLNQAGGYSSTEFATDVTNKTQKSICSVDLVHPPSMVEKKEVTLKTKLAEPIKAGESKQVKLNLNIGAASLLRIYDCEKTPNKISETTIQPNDQRSLVVE